MRKMIKTKRDLKIQLHTRQYSNGQLAVYIQDYIGHPIAELSIMNDLVTLAPNEFILEDYSENKDFVEEIQAVSYSNFPVVSCLDGFDE